MTLCVIGAGYVGLVSAACFSEFGWDVRCIDKDRGKIARLKKSEIPIYEIGLEEMVRSNVASGRLKFSCDLKQAVKVADIVFLAVGTPTRPGDGHADLSHVFAAVDEIAPHLDGFTVIVTKSTVPVGTSRKIEERLKKLRPDADFSVCSNPEFLREGTALQDFMQPDRVIVGCDDPRSEKLLRDIYRPLTSREVPLLVVGRESAELAKYAANAFLAMKISFINQIADLCERVGADVREVSSGVGSDKRIGARFLQPGPGYGGSCFPKDVAAIIRTARDKQVPLTLIEAVQHINDERKIDMTRRIREACGGSLAGKTIGVLGITFKAGTDDIRESPSLTIVPVLASEGATVRVYDPQGRTHAERILPQVEWCSRAIDVASAADAVVILTEWPEFNDLDLKDVRARMRGDVLVDFRDVLNSKAVAAARLSLVGIGRRGVETPSAQHAIAVKLKNRARSNGSDWDADRVKAQLKGANKIRRRKDPSSLPTNGAAT